MPEQPQLAHFDVEKQQLYSELLSAPAEHGLATVSRILLLVMYGAMDPLHLMKTGKMMNQTISTMWKTVLKCRFGGGEKQENGMTCTVTTKESGFVRFEEESHQMKWKLQLKNIITQMTAGLYTIRICILSANTCIFLWK